MTNKEKKQNTEQVNNSQQADQERKAEETPQTPGQQATDQQGDKKTDSQEKNEAQTAASPGAAQQEEQAEDKKEGSTEAPKGEEKQEEKSSAKTDKKSEKKSSKKESKDKKRIEELEQQLKEMQDKYLRLSAEFDNYRKRTLKEKMELTKSAGEDVLKDILPVMDNFERAQQSVQEAQDIDAVREGIDLIYNRFKEFLQQNGVKEIEAVNQPFDTDVHEAVTKIPAPEEDMKGKVVDVVQKGYYLNDKVLRYAKVVVGE